MALEPYDPCNSNDFPCVFRDCVHSLKFPVYNANADVGNSARVATEQQQQNVMSDLPTSQTSKYMRGNSVHPLKTELGDKVASLLVKL